MKNLNLALMLTFFLTIVSFFITCSDENPTDSDSSTNSAITFTPSTTTAQGISWIELTGLPNDSSDYSGIVTSITTSLASSSAVEDTAYTYVIRADSGDFMIMPLYPPDPIHGGVVQIILTDGNGNFSEPMEFTVDSLPEAPNEYSEVVSLMQDMFTMNLYIAGLTRDSLDYQSASEIPLTRLPYYLTYNVIDNPANPNSMRAIADGPVPYLNNNSIDIELLDRLMKIMDLRAYYEDIVAKLDTTTSPEFFYSKDELSNIRISSSQTCIVAPDYGITTCAQLAAAMSDQANRAAASASASEKVFNDVIKSTLLGVSLIPGAASVTAVLGGGLWTKKLMKSGFENMLPSEFVDEATSFNPSKIEFNEDYTDPGTWSEFKVTAVSNGWKLDKMALEGVFQAFGALGAGAGISNVPTPFEQNVTGAMKGFFEGQAQEAAIDELTEGEDFVEICPNTWSNINCADEDYSTTTVLSGDLVIDETEKIYEPFEVGVATFKIETSGAFIDDLTGIATSINTKEIEIFIDPFQAEADTNETVYFSVRVENAEDTRVEFSHENGGMLTSGGMNASITAPNTPWDPPIILKAKSLSETGLRATDPTPREDEAEITYKDEGAVLISPNGICLKPDSSETFTALLTGGTINTITWETVPSGIGSFSGSGTTITFTAPSTHEGQIQIKATANESKVGYSEVDISECICYWTFDGFGSEYVYSLTGQWSSASDLGALSVLLKQTESDFLPQLGFVAYNAFEPGDYTTDAISFTGVDEITWSVKEEALPVVTITEYVFADYVKGSVSGTLSNRTGSNPPTYEHITFSISFRAEFFNLDRPKCVNDSL